MGGSTFPFNRHVIRVETGVIVPCRSAKFKMSETCKTKKKTCGIGPHCNQFELTAKPSLLSIQNNLRAGAKLHIRLRLKMLTESITVSEEDGPRVVFSMSFPDARFVHSYFYRYSHDFECNFV